MVSKKKEGGVKQFLQTNSNLILKKLKKSNAKILHIIRLLFGSQYNYLITTVIVAKPDLLLAWLMRNHGESAKVLSWILFLMFLFLTTY